MNILLGVLFAILLHDVPYRLNAEDDYAQKFCTLDARFPDVHGFKTVVWLHDGGLTSGKKHFIGIDPRIGQVSPDYRLLGREGLKDGTECIRDAAAAVAWALRHVSRYGGDVKKVYVAGMSAGGYLTMMVGMAPKYLAEYGFKPADLAGLAPVSGQATTHFNVRKFAGDGDPQFLPKIDDLAPLRWVSADLPPIISICGEAPWEWKCRSEENRLLIASCTALGHRDARFVQLPFADHELAFTCGVSYVELFIQGRIPPNLTVSR